jgi:hypothetical protein
LASKCCCVVPALNSRTVTLRRANARYTLILDGVVPADLRDSEETEGSHRRQNRIHRRIDFIGRGQAHCSASATLHGAANGSAAKLVGDATVETERESREALDAARSVVEIDAWGTRSLRVEIQGGQSSPAFMYLLVLFSKELLILLKATSCLRGDAGMSPPPTFPYVLAGGYRSRRGCCACIGDRSNRTARAVC